ncbi:MAG: nucleoside kinase, partial [Clostridia bacterium]|nr:nucleoside kinase [Clostridia bacterium]
SMDNYYYRRADGWMPNDEEGQIDFESPDLIDMPLLRQHLEMMAECKPVEMPTFDFAGQRRGDKTIPVHRKPGEIIVMEGNHALNPQVLGQETDLATGIYISVRTRVQDDNGFVLHPSRIRLARRLLRDFRHRGQDYAATVTKLRSVSRGERLYIDPNKNNAAIQFDTFIPYELAVYRNEIIYHLGRVDATFLEDLGVSELMPFLRQIDPISEKYVPENALIQEFIGDED